MKIAVWKTGHEIAETVTQALVKGFDANTWDAGSISDKECIEGLDVNIGYGILRGTGEVFKEADRLGKHWFNVDRGYFNPSHYDGYYRISYKGTQAKYDSSFNIVSDHLLDSGMGAIPALEPVRKHDKNKPVLICPPTDAVCSFFGFKWWDPKKIEQKLILRQKGDQSPIPWNDISVVITFNSAIGWQAIQRGIPCLSDTIHSVVGSYYSTKSIDEMIERFNTMPRKPLFDFMRAHQFTLNEIRQGNAWPLVNHYLSSSATIAGSPLLPMSPPIAFAAGLQSHFQSIT